MLDLLQNPSTIRFFGITGSLVAFLGALVSGLAYRGRQGERYSPLNHFISELGEVGVSPLAWVFNLGLLLSGLLVLPLVVGLSLRISSGLGWLGLAAGVAAALALSGVGLYPMNNLTPHVRSAMTFFRTGLVMILLFSAAILFQPANSAVPVKLAGAGLPAILAYSLFLTYSAFTYRPSEIPLSAQFEQRPRVWVLAILEWTIFLTTVPWFLAVSLGIQ